MTNPSKYNLITLDNVLGIVSKHCSVINPAALKEELSALNLTSIESRTQAWNDAYERSHLPKD